MELAHVPSRFGVDMKDKYIEAVSLFRVHAHIHADVDLAQIIRKFEEELGKLKGVETWFTEITDE